MEYCEKCGWVMEYKPRSFQEHIQEIIGGQEKSGYLECPKCGLIKKCEKNKEN